MQGKKRDSDLVRTAGAVVTRSYRENYKRALLWLGRTSKEDTMRGMSACLRDAKKRGFVV